MILPEFSPEAESAIRSWLNQNINEALKDPVFRARLSYEQYIDHEHFGLTFITDDNINSLYAMQKACQYVVMEMLESQAEETLREAEIPFKSWLFRLKTFDVKPVSSGKMEVTIAAKWWLILR